MDSIAEVMTPEQTIYLRFDAADREQVQAVEDCLEKMADADQVYELTIQAMQ